MDLFFQEPNVCALCTLYFLEIFDHCLFYSTYMLAQLENIITEIKSVKREH